MYVVKGQKTLCIQIYVVIRQKTLCIQTYVAIRHRTLCIQNYVVICHKTCLSADSNCKTSDCRESKYSVNILPALLIGRSATEHMHGPHTRELTRLGTTIKTATTQLILSQIL